jgi:hypothetical protein
MIISLRKKYIRRRNRIKVIESDLRKFSPKIQYEVCHNLTYGRLNWKILPSGEMSFERLINYYNKLQKENTHRVYEKERLDLIENLNPSKRYIGLGQFKSYVVYRFNYTEKAILENPYKGNAIYILSGDWRKLSQMSKSELLDTNLTHVQRIVHNGNWYDKLQQAICD